MTADCKVKQMGTTGKGGSGAYDLLEKKRDGKLSVRRHSCQDQSLNNLSPSSSDVKEENMVYLGQLLPTYLLHFTYGISLGVVI